MQMMTWSSLSAPSCLCWEWWKRRSTTFAPTNGEQNFMQIGSYVLCGILPTLWATCTRLVDFLIGRYKNLKRCEKIWGQFIVLLFSCLLFTATHTDCRWNRRQALPERPRYVIPSEQPSSLRSEFNSWTEIAADLGVSRQTIYNRRRELGFSLVFEG